MQQFALLAGSAAAAIFIVSQLPMLIKARRTKNLTSYSFANIGLANVGNALYAVYVFHVPIGPVWATHGFNLTTSGLMLFWYLRYGRSSGADVGSRLPRTPAEPGQESRSVTVRVGSSLSDEEFATPSRRASDGGRHDRECFERRRRLQRRGARCDERAGRRAARGGEEGCPPG